MKNFLVVAAVCLVANVHPSLAQSKYILGKSSGIGAFGGYVTQPDFGFRMGGLGLSLLGRLDVSFAYGTSRVEELHDSGTDLARGTVSTVTPAIAYYFAKASQDQPLNLGVVASYSFVKVSEMEYVRTHSRYRGKKTTRSVFVGGDFSGVITLLPELSLLPGVSFAYGLYHSEAGEIGSVLSPTLGATVGLRFDAAPELVLFVEPGLIHTTQAEPRTSASFTGGLVLKPFLRTR